MRAGFVSQTRAAWFSNIGLGVWELYRNPVAAGLQRANFINAAESDTMKEVQHCSVGSLAFVEIFFDHFSPRSI